MNEERESERSAALEARLHANTLRGKLPAPAMRRALRKNLGLPAVAVAEFCGVSRQLVSMWEAGTRTPSGPRLEAYVEFLDRLTRERS